MRRILMSAFLGTALLGLPALTGCDNGQTADQPRAVEQKTVEKREDGTEVKTETKTEKQPDGSTVTTETKDVDK